MDTARVSRYLQCTASTPTLCCTRACSVLHFEYLHCAVLHLCLHCTMLSRCAWAVYRTLSSRPVWRTLASRSRVAGWRSRLCRWMISVHTCNSGPQELRHMYAGYQSLTDIPRSLQVKVKCGVEWRGPRCNILYCCRRSWWTLFPSIKTRRAGRWGRPLYVLFCCQLYCTVVFSSIHNSTLVYCSVILCNVLYCTVVHSSVI